MSPVQPPVTETEMRELLDDAGIQVDGETMPMLLVAVQPMRANLRESDATRRASMLRGLVITSRRRPSTIPSPGEPAPADALPPVSPLKRLGVLYAAVVMGMFALMTLVGEERAPTFFFGGLALALLLIAITGWGLGRERPARKGSHRIGTVLGAILLASVAGPFLLTSIVILVSPQAWREWDFVSNTMRLVGLVTIGILVSYARGRRSPG